MKKTINLFILILLTVCISLVFSSCNKTPAGTDSGVYSGPVTEIGFWIHDQGGQTMKLFTGMIEEFNNQNPEINVNMSIVAAGATSFASLYDNRLIPAIAAGEAPDIIMIEGIIQDSIQKGFVAEITEYIDDDPEFSMDIFYNHKVTQCLYDDKYYALPWNTDYAGILIYNRNSFRRAGLDPTSPPQTIEELDRFAEALTIEEDGSYSQIGFYPWTWLTKRPESIVRPFGGQLADSEGNPTPLHPGNIQALEWMKSYADKYGYAKVNQSASQLGANFGTEFSSGAAAMDYVYNGQIMDLVKRSIGFEWDIAPFPTINGDTSIDPGWGRGLLAAITPQSENKTEAFKFLKYYCGPEGMDVIVENWETTTLISSIPSINEKYSATMPRQIQYMINEIYPNITPENFTEYNRVEYGVMFEQAIEKVLTGAMDTRAALQDVANKIEVLMSEN